MKAYIPLRSAVGILVALTLILITDFILAYLRIETRVRYYIPASFLICVLFAYVAVKMPRLSKAVLIVLVVIFSFTAIFTLFWLDFSLCSGYKTPDTTDKAELFSDKNVMLIVPHEDDDLNLLGGVIEQYISFGSSIRVVFSTNGDFYGRESGQQRINEAIEVLTDLGLTESNIIFLGYSDCMSSDKGYFFDQSDCDAQVYSYDKKISSTYGTDTHPAYNNGNSFSRRHLTQDLKDCILEYKPDTIFCVDRDSNLDHIALSLIFEEVMGQILSQHTEYKPIVLKGFAYDNAFFAKPDFYKSVNIISTEKPCDGEYMNEDPAYLWTERLRLPVYANSFSRSMLRCRMWRSSLSYASQEMFKYANKVTNGDKVFWLRDTCSLSYAAEISASSGNYLTLSDFCLRDTITADMSNSSLYGIWIPSDEDAAPWIDIRFKSPFDITQIRMYDSPSLTDNILGATISFDNGNTYKTGPLKPNGSATEIAVNESDVSSIRIVIDAREGSASGLTELEVYETQPELCMPFIKLTDSQGNLIYDYITSKEGRDELSLYAVYAPAELSEENYCVTSSNPKCKAYIADEKIIITCPRGQNTVLKIQRNDGSLSDSVYISNPRISLLDLWMSVEEYAYDGACGMYVQPIFVKVWYYLLGNSCVSPA